MSDAVDEDAFLDAILRDPEDLNLRLVYADWLEERGDPRAEYLRIECRLEAARRDVRELPARLRTLGADVDRDWLSRITLRYAVLLERPVKLIETIKVLRGLCRVGLKDAKDLAESAPVLVADELTCDEADEIIRQFDGVAHLRLVPAHIRI